MDINLVLFKIINELNLNNTSTYFKAYHISPFLKSIKKYGIMSSNSMYYLNKQLFHDITFRNYEMRAKKYLKKSKVTDEDILYYLDNARLPLTSNSIWFSFIPSNIIPYINVSGNKCEFDIPLDTIKKYSLNDPIIVYRRNYNQCTWKEFYSNYNKYVEKAYNGATKLPPPTNGLMYTNIIHFAVDCNTIPFSELNIIS